MQDPGTTFNQDNEDYTYYLCQKFQDKPLSAVFVNAYHLHSIHYRQARIFKLFVSPN